MSYNLSCEVKNKTYKVAFENKEQTKGRKPKTRFYYENTPIQIILILKISPPKTESYQIKILIFFIFLLKTYIVGTR